jgi:hypothetical protein
MLSSFVGPPLLALPGTLGRTISSYPMLIGLCGRLSALTSTSRPEMATDLVTAVKKLARNPKYEGSQPKQLTYPSS